jgi:basic membrane protein A
LVPNTSGHGVIQAAKEKGVYAFGAVSDQNILAPNTVLASFVLDVSKAFDQAIKMVQGETLLDRHLNLGWKRA